MMRTVCLLASCAAVPAPASADPVSPDFGIHGQATVVLQGMPGFETPYAGKNSLTPHRRKETIDATLCTGVLQ